MQKKVEFLGHVVDENGIHTDPAKVKAMQEVVSPKCIGDLRTSLGFTEYYRKFISDHADIAAPLYDLLKKKKQANLTGLLYVKMLSYHWNRNW